MGQKICAVRLLTNQNKTAVTGLHKPKQVHTQGSHWPKLNRKKMGATTHNSLQSPEVRSLTPFCNARGPQAKTILQYHMDIAQKKPTSRGL